MFNHKILLTLGTMLPIATSLSLVNPSTAQAYSVTLDPVTTFEVGDGFFNQSFDGKGDEVFNGNFETVVLGTIAENSENAEYDLRHLVIPAGETITSALFQFTVSDAQTFGSGAPNAPSSGLVVRGYAGNGQADAADFQAGNILGTQRLANGYAVQNLQFDVSNFIKQLIQQPNAIAGFSVRAKDLGAQSLTKYPAPPKLIITTASTHEPPKSTPEASTSAGLAGLGLLGTYVTARRRRVIGR
jgi:hypothetical protein